MEAKWLLALFVTLSWSHSFGYTLENFRPAVGGNRTSSAVRRRENNRSRLVSYARLQNVQWPNGREVAWKPRGNLGK